jgi:phospholipid/cholesterol/gamma-HCH transport system permease protein
MSDQGPKLEVLDKKDQKLSLRISGRLSAKTAGNVWREAEELLEKSHPSQLLLDAAPLEYCDMTGVCFFQELKNRQDSSGGTFQVDGLSADIKNLFEIVSQRHDKATAKKEIPKVHFIEALGRTAEHYLSDLYDQIAFIGEALSHLVKALSHPRSIRWKDVWVFIEKAGVDAVPLVSLTGFLIGVIMAFQSALPLRQTGSDLFVANVVAFTVLRELGPLITAIILAGRTGSAIAAEIGTMKINEEIDALTTMGFEPVRFLVVSRILGILFLAPLLTIVCDFFGMVGGAVVFRTLGYSLTTYMHQIVTVVTLRDIFGGLLKAYPFAIAVGGIGCLHGLRTKAGASAVGESTTSSVVTGMLTIIILDGVISAIYYVLGI